MHRLLLAVSSLLVFAILPGLAAQELTRDQFMVDFNKALELQDEKLADKAMKRGALHALLYYEALWLERASGSADPSAKLTALQASWKRCFDNGETMEKLHRWLDGADRSQIEALHKTRANSSKLWTFYQDSVSKELVKLEYKKVMQQYMELARNAESIGHMLEVADLWGMASVVGSKMPEQAVEDKRDTLFASKQFLEARERWGLTFDEHYVRTREWAKAETQRMEEAEKADEKRRAAGYDPNAKGIDTLVMPGVQEMLPLAYEALATWEAELDYGPKNGPVPAFWWMASLEKDGSNRKLDWFQRVPLYVMRLGAAKFGVALEPDPKKAVEIEVSQKGKPSTFWLDADKKQPYSMFFWCGSDRERIGEAECNLQHSDEVANIYYRSAASWKATIGTEAVTLYDDSANGQPGDASPFEPPLKVHTLGDPDGEGTVAPLLDSMRIGKGPRVPFSEFVYLAGGWKHVRRSTVDSLLVRPLNPEFVKFGKVKLVWSGPKPTAPVQLVVQGAGDYMTALFDLASGKEVEVPAGSYSVIFGRIVVGKGARAQTATIYRGDAPAFDVEPGKTFELKMGAPFSITFARRGDENTEINALKIMLREASGCALTELQGMSVVPEVLAAKAEDGKGAKVVGKFVRFADWELVLKASKKAVNLGNFVACFPMPDGYREGDLVLSVKLPAAGMKVGLAMKKHPLFGPLTSTFQ